MPRGKSKAQNDFDQAHRYSCVSVKLHSFLRDEPFWPSVHRLLDDAAHSLSKLVFEAYILANQHVSRYLDKGQPLPEIDQSFFNSCLSLVSDSKRNAGSPELQETAEQYFVLRPAGFPVVNTKYLSCAMASLAKQMVTMLRNHIVLNVVKRLCDCIRFKYEEIDNNAEAKEFLCSAMYEEDQQKVTNQMREFKAWLGEHNPFWENMVKKNIPYYVGKLFEIL